MIKDVFDEMAAARAEREEAMCTKALARDCADEDAGAEDDLDSVDADEDEKYGALFEELGSPSN